RFAAPGSGSVMAATLPSACRRWQRERSARARCYHAGVTPRFPSRHAAVVESLQTMLAAFTETQEMIARAGPDVCDFLAGNPQEPAMPAYVEALQTWAEPQR